LVDVVGWLVGLNNAQGVMPFRRLIGGFAGQIKGRAFGEKADARLL
jgi:hypothetical protein